MLAGLLLSRNTGQVVSSKIKSKQAFHVNNRNEFRPVISKIVIIMKGLIIWLLKIECHILYLIVVLELLSL